MTLNRILALGLIGIAASLASCGVTSQLHSELNFGNVAVEPVSLERFGDSGSP